MIVADTKVLESINMSSKIKGVYKGDVLILIVCDGGKEVSCFYNMLCTKYNLQCSNDN